MERESEIVERKIPQQLFDICIRYYPKYDKNDTRLDYCYAITALHMIAYSSDENSMSCFGWVPSGFHDGKKFQDDWWQPASIIGKHIFDLSTDERELVLQDIVSAKRRGEDWETIAAPYAASLPNIKHYGKSDRPVLVALSKLELDNKYNFRVKDHQDVVDRYAALVKKKDGVQVFDDPCEVFWVDNRLILVGGFLRVRATIQAGYSTIQANITYGGTEEDAFDAALLENIDHGPEESKPSCYGTPKPKIATDVLEKVATKLTGAQKRERITEAIAANPTASDREIGRLISCDHKTVGTVRRSTILT